MACGIFLDQGSNLCLLHWQVDSLPPSQWQPTPVFLLETPKDRGACRLQSMVLQRVRHNWAANPKEALHDILHVTCCWRQEASGSGRGLRLPVCVLTCELDLGRAPLSRRMYDLAWAGDKRLFIVFILFYYHYTRSWFESDFTVMFMDFWSVLLLLGFCLK